MTAGVEVWRGGVNAWECDDNGHLNTRFYLARAMEGAAMLMVRLGLAGAFAPGAATTVVPRAAHVRFHREALLATPLRLSASVTAMRADEADLALLLDDPSEGTLRAAFRLRMAHVRADDPGAALPWPAPVHAAAAALLAPVPDAARPRSTDDAAPASLASNTRAAALDLMPIAMGMIGPDRVDAFGRMRPEVLVGAVSDGVRSLTAPFRDIVQRHADPPVARPGGAVLEARMLFLRWPRIGEGYLVRSGLAGIAGHAKSLVHWMLDPAGGQPWGTMQSIAVDFDLDRRALVRLTPAARDALTAACVPGLAL